MKVLFVCHGNICRSPMAEYLFRDMAQKAGVCVEVASAATSSEELGSPIYPPAMQVLRRLGIDGSKKRARQLTRQDDKLYDYILGMDGRNMTNIGRILGKPADNRIFRLLDLSENPRDIADPWYTGDFEQTLQDLQEGCALLLEKLRKDGSGTPQSSHRSD